MKIYLASQSPRRQELLQQINIPFELVFSEIDESVLAQESPMDYVIRMALEKARAGWAAADRVANQPLLAADTSVIADSKILGKPKDRAEAFDMLKRLSNCTHEVITSIAMTNGNKVDSATSVTRVTFATMKESEIESYIDSGDCFDKAGGYGIQGHAAKYISSISGSYSGVMGLPLYETAQLIASFQHSRL